VDLSISIASADCLLWCRWRTSGASAGASVKA
jgi:hypothetical protein